MRGCGVRGARGRGLPRTPFLRHEALPAVLGEHPVGHIGAHFGGAERCEHLLALDERAAGLDEVVDDDDVASHRVALLQLHDALVPLPHLRAMKERAGTSLSRARSIHSDLLVGCADYPHMP